MHLFSKPSKKIFNSSFKKGAYTESIGIGPGLINDLLNRKQQY